MAHFEWPEWLRMNFNVYEWRAVSANPLKFFCAVQYILIASSLSSSSFLLADWSMGRRADEEFDGMTTMMLTTMMAMMKIER